jgi:hypothetical protein
MRHNCEIVIKKAKTKTIGEQLISEKVSFRNAERARSNRRERRRKGEKEQEWYKVDNTIHSIQKVIICYNISKQC